MKHQTPEVEKIHAPVQGGLFLEPLRLGMPHLNARGVSLNWLLRESCHRHWWALARDLGCAPGDIRDAGGARAMASVVAAVLSGRPSDFAEDGMVRIGQVTAPSAANGWRSVTILEADRGGYLSVELVTAFIRRDGPSNRDLVRALMPEPLRAVGRDLQARRARLLRATGRTLRATAEADARPPHLSVRICPETHMNGVGLMYFANFVDCFAQVEGNALPPRAAAMPLVTRELHYFGNIDAGDMLDLHSEVGVTRLGVVPRVETVSSARRRSDGAVIAVCRTAREGADPTRAATG